MGRKNCKENSNVKGDMRTMNTRENKSFLQYHPETRSIMRAGDKYDSKFQLSSANSFLVRPLHIERLLLGLTTKKPISKSECQELSSHQIILCYGNQDS